MDQQPAYTLSDLSRLADVTPRTVRYYVAQGLLPPPDAAGPATRYDAGHLARLRAIKRLQREHLPLAEIRARLDGRSDEQILAIAEWEAGAQREPKESALDYIRQLRGGERLAEAPALYERVAMRKSIEPSPPPRVRAMRMLTDATPPSPPKPGVERSTWERTALTPDVELHVRRPLDRVTNKRVERLVRIARELFEDDA
jgi:DNA-binding transcriptional MerR regulator